jgi:hypothetical protein
MIMMDLFVASTARFDQDDRVRLPLEHWLAEAANSLAYRPAERAIRKRGIRNSDTLSDQQVTDSENISVPIAPQKAP